MELLTPNGDVIRTKVVVSEADQEQGLSGKKPEDFADDQGMLFYYFADDEKNFWMPDTYFDLDLFYLDQNLKVVDIIRKLPHYVGRANPDIIPRARPVWCRHTLEMKASSPLAKKIYIGDQLKWKGNKSVTEMDTLFRRELKN
jgi:uncharacterized membrane protein (UPF0127 family)